MRTRIHLYLHSNEVTTNQAISLTTKKKTTSVYVLWAVKFEGTVFPPTSVEEFSDPDVNVLLEHISDPYLMIVCFPLISE